MFRLWPLQPGSQTLRKEIHRFFGPDLVRFETHDKQFPGYDLASVCRAVNSFLEENCREVRAIGSCQGVTIRQLLDLLDQPYYKNLKPNPPTYQRAQVDVDEEESVVTNCLYFAMMKPADAAGQPEKIAVYLTVNGYRQEYWESMEPNRVPFNQVVVGVLCRNRQVANHIFNEIESRRRRMSVFRGKLIDPALHSGFIMDINFRPVKKVVAEDLILPDAIKKLLHDTILGFYNHKEILKSLDIEMKRGILLHGPPGTGKTSICLYLAGLLSGFTVCFVSGERLLYPREICRMARYLQPAMLVFEDIDLVAQERDANGLATVLGELMNQIDGCEPTDQVLFIMTTNSIKRLESAVKNRPGRVDQIIQIPLPNPDERTQLLRFFARKITLAIDQMDKVLEATDGMTPAMLKEIVKRAAVMALENNGQAQEVAIKEEDLLLAALQVQEMRDKVSNTGSLGFSGVKGRQR